MIYLTTDTHFNHDKMVEYCGRPNNFEDIIKDDIYNNVSPNDLLIHLGDVCIGKDKENNQFFRGVCGSNILCKGNHDNKTTEWYLGNGWDVVCDKFYMTYKGKKICFSHTPQKDDGSFDINIHGHFHNQLPRLKERRWVVDGEEERNKYDLSVLTEKHILLSLEETNYKLTKLDSLIK